MKRVLLIDADVLAYEAASGCEKVTHWGEGYYTWSCQFQDVVDHFDAALAKIVETLKGDPVLCLTDSLGNFRFDVLPTYKGNRASTKKPLVLKDFKQFLIDERGAYFRPGLEGDDCMGILMTRANPSREERVIVSLDKDMKTIPGLVCRWPIEQKPRLISEAEADYWHLYQTLTGDQTDGYSGCPGVGPKKAEAILSNLKRGCTGPCGLAADSDCKNSVCQDRSVTAWQAVVEAYEKAGFSEEVALQQARVARILRASDYDFKERKPILWTP